MRRRDHGNICKESILATAHLSTKANSIELALTNDHCPYCGSHAKRLDKHLEDCRRKQQNLEYSKITKSTDKWAVHEECGKVMILHRSHGLCLVEADGGRYVVPIMSLKFGALSHLVSQIENADLSDDEASILINILRVKAKEYHIPKHPDLWNGCRVEIQLGEHVKSAVIVEKNGNNYVAEVGTKRVNIAPKNIIRIM